MKHRFLIWILFILSGFFCFIYSSAILKKNRKEKNQFNLLKYDVEIQGKKMGWMTCRKTISENDASIINYIIDSEVMVNIVTNYTIQFNSMVTFKNSNLFTSNYLTKVNGDTQSFSKINWDGSRYKGWNGKKNTIISENKIPHSIGEIYYKEPVGLNQIFSEKHMVMCQVSKSGDYYTVSSPDGKSTLYKYQNGICIWAQTNQKLYKITFRLKEIN